MQQRWADTRSIERISCFFYVIQRWRQLMCSQRSHDAIWIWCKKINASSFMAPTLFGAQYRLPLRPKLTHPAARFLCDS